MDPLRLAARTRSPHLRSAVSRGTRGHRRRCHGTVGLRRADRGREPPRVVQAVGHGHRGGSPRLALYVEVALQAFGVERLMYESDRPVCTLAAPQERRSHVHGGSPSPPRHAAFVSRGCQRGCQIKNKPRIGKLKARICARTPRESGEPAGIRTQDTRIKSLCGERPPRHLVCVLVHCPPDARPSTPPRCSELHRRGCQRGCQPSPTWTPINCGDALSGD